MTAQQQRFSSRLTTLITMAGLAIGLGNVWRFPYMMGQHGGSAFLLVYSVFMFALAVPALAAEFSLGRATRKGPVASFQAAYGSRLGRALGLTVLSAVFMATCYYSIIIANVFYSAWFAATRGFSEQSLAAYGAGLDVHGLQYLIAVVVVMVCAMVVRRGLQSGIEAINKLLMPIFGLAAIYLVVATLSLEGAMDKMQVFLKPDFSSAGPGIWFAAMGQACFSVGLSGTLCVMYGSYLKRDEPLVPMAIGTCAIDLGAAFMAALFVVPAVLIFGLDLAAGPGLLFDTLPHLFAVMPGGRWLAPIFLAGWALVAMLTLVAALDTVTGALADLTGPRMNRQRWLWLITFAACATILPIAFNPHWIGLLDLIFGSGMFMLGALLAVIGVGWGLGQKTVSLELATGLSPSMATLATFWVRFIVPIALTAILIGFLWSTLTT